MKDICNFIQSDDNQIAYYHFVYQVGFKRLAQPFCHNYSKMHLVTKGEATLKINNKEYPLKVGSVFFTFPFYSFTIDGSDNFTYLYISFSGEFSDKLLKDMNISKDLFVFHGYDYLISFWMDSIRKITTQNSTLLTDSVFKYTLSHLATHSDTPTHHQSDKMSCILDYIEKNYTNPDISIGVLSDIFFYNEKYFSFVFKKETGQNFTQYLNNLKVEKAKEDFKKDIKSINEVSANCGFSDPLYFSKVFKKITTLSPSEYIKNHRN